MKKIKVMISERHRLYRDAFACTLADDTRFELVAECEDADKAFELVPEKKPDLILMNIGHNIIPNSHMMDVTKKISSKYPFTQIISISVFAEPSYAKKMLAMGARGCLTKNSSKEELIKAMLEVSNGKKYLCDDIKNSLSQQLLSAEEVPAVFNISKREQEIINLIKEGYTSKQIAATLHISFRTVEVHRHNILKKLKIKNTPSLIKYANTHM
jgi:DNA-binding NarL/FixJ family response regulator